MIYDQLYGLNSQLRPQPQMVETWEVSDDQSTYTFTLYPDMQFQDGTPEAAEFKALFSKAFPKLYKKVRFPDSSSIGIKPISREGSERRTAFIVQTPDCILGLGNKSGESSIQTNIKRRELVREHVATA